MQGFVDGDIRMLTWSLQYTALSKGTFLLDFELADLDESSQGRGAPEIHRSIWYFLKVVVSGESGS